MNTKKLGWLYAIIGTTLVMVAMANMAGAEEYEVTVADCDINNDGIVDDLDVSLLQEAYGQRCEPGALPEDIDHNGRVYTTDISYLQKYYGEEVPSDPEPEEFIVEEWHIDFDANYTSNVAMVIGVTGNISWEVVEITIRNGELLQQPTTTNVTENDMFVLSEGNITVRYPKTNLENETETNAWGRTFYPMVEEEPVVNETGSTQEQNETEPEPVVEIVNDAEEPPVEDTYKGYTWDAFDINDDGSIDCADKDALVEKYRDRDNIPSEQLGKEDINQDGILNAGDLSIFVNGAGYFAPDIDCNEPEPEPEPVAEIVNETEQQNEIIDPLEEQINNIEANITGLEGERDHLIRLRDAFVRAINRWQHTMSNFLLNLAYTQIETVFNAKINALDNEINTLNGQILQLLSEQAETFIPNEG
jgi:hypothetical protein